jgi:hypothetical protein
LIFHFQHWYGGGAMDLLLIRQKLPYSNASRTK